MRFFTMARWNGKDRSAWPTAAYKEHLEGIRDRVHTWFIEPAFSPHDSQLRSMRMDIARGELTLEIANASWSSRGGKRVEQGKARFWFGGVSLLESTADAQSGLPGEFGFGDWGYEEVNVANDGLLEFRFLFSSAIELRVLFTEFKAEWIGFVSQQ